MLYCYKQLKPDLVKTDVTFLSLDKFFNVVGRVHFGRKNVFSFKGLLLGRKNRPLLLRVCRFFLAYFHLYVKDKIGENKS